MKNFEQNYAKLVNKVVTKGERRNTRNGFTFSIFGESFKFDMSDSVEFPLLVGRKMYPKGILGEFAAFLRGPKSIKDFEFFGCNYWGLWAKSDGSIKVDYGNLWKNWNGVDQLQNVIDLLKNDPYNRRILISSWKPDTLDELDLPCCHYAYQWYVRNSTYLDMIWIQRSVDIMVGLPSDIVLAAVWNIVLANQVGLRPGKIKMDLGDCHIYKEHVQGARTYISRVASEIRKKERPYYRLKLKPKTPIQLYTPNSIEINRYHPMDPIHFKLKK